MNKNILFFFIAFISKVALCQTTNLSFISHPLSALQGFSPAQIDSLISKAPLENFRLQDKHTTLTFDNGFEIELLSANEIARLGIITDPSSYQKDYADHYNLPVFHLLPNGHIMAAYTSAPGKFKGR